MDPFDESPEHLKARVKNLEEKLEGKIQENHELKMRLQQKENMENDLKAEVDSLMTELGTKDNRIKSLELKIKTTPATVDTSDKDMEIDKMQGKISALEDELNATRRDLESARAAAPAENWDNSIREELHSVQAELATKETILKEKVDYFNELVNNLNHELEDKNKQLCHLESSVEHLREELANSKEEIEQFEGELQLTKAQLMNLQQASVEQDVESKNARGNSLFSEVEDNRLKAMSVLKNYKKDADQAIGDLAVAKAEIHALKVENVSLSRKWEEFIANNSLLLAAEDTFKKKMTEAIERLTGKVQEAEQKSLRIIDELIPERMSNHQWLKSYLKSHLTTEHELKERIRNLEMNELWAKEAQHQMNKKYNMQLAESTSLRIQVERLKLDCEKFENQENALPKAIEADLEAGSSTQSSVTPSREQALKKLLDAVYLRGKKPSKTLAFAEDVKKDDESARKLRKLVKPTKEPIFIKTEN